MNTQFFPDFGIDIIVVSVRWPGASAADVDSNVVQAIEPEVRFLDGVKRVRSNSVEGLATVVVEFEPGSDMQAALSDVETGVGQITTLPEDSERPIIRRVSRFDTISRLIVSGPYPERSLKAVAKRIRDGLLALGIDKIDMFGARDEEIWVEVKPTTLRRLDMTLADIAKEFYGDSSKWKLIAQTNNIDPRKLKVGMKLIIADIAGGAGTPAAEESRPEKPLTETKEKIHVVAKGDSLWNIAKKYYGDGNKYKLIMKANNIKDAGALQVGQKLTIPAE